MNKNKAPYLAIARETRASAQKTGVAVAFMINYGGSLQVRLRLGD